MKQLEHPQGFFTFAFIDRDRGKAFFIEVPMQTLRVSVPRPATTDHPAIPSGRESFALSAKKPVGRMVAS